MVLMGPEGSKHKPGPMTRALALLFFPERAMTRALALLFFPERAMTRALALFRFTANERPNECECHVLVLVRRMVFFLRESSATLF